MTIPPFKDALGRPPIELVGIIADSTTSASSGGVGGTSGGGSAGRCAVCGEFGNGNDPASIVVGEYGDTPPVPFGIVFDHWDVLAYDESGDPVAIDAVLHFFSTDFATNNFQPIDGTEHPTLTGAQKDQKFTLADWTPSQPAYTMYRWVLASFTDVSGTCAKIVVAAQGVAS